MNTYSWLARSLSNLLFFIWTNPQGERGGEFEKMKSNKYKRTIIFLVLVVALVLLTSSSAFGFVQMSPDKVTCTPCHTDGRMGDGKGGEIPPPQLPKPPASQPAPKPAPAPAPAPQPVDSVQPEPVKSLVVFAPSVEWDQLWDWAEKQVPEQIPEKYDELFF